MSFSIVDKRVPYDGSMPIRRYAVSGLTVHGVAGLSLVATSDQFDGSDGVNANFLIGPAGEIWLKVSEERRAYTSGSPTDGGKGADFDHRRITVEIVNTGDIYSFSQASIDALIWLAVYLGKKYGFVYTRDVGGNFEGHRELWERYRASYPTACPTSFPLDGAAVEANRQITGSSGGSGKDKYMRIVFAPWLPGQNTLPGTPVVGDYVSGASGAAGNPAVSGGRYLLVNEVSGRSAQIRGTQNQIDQLGAFIRDSSTFVAPQTTMDWVLTQLAAVAPAGGSGGGITLADKQQIAQLVDDAIDDEKILALATALAARPAGSTPAETRAAIVSVLTSIK